MVKKLGKGIVGFFGLRNRTNASPEGTMATRAVRKVLAAAGTIVFLWGLGLNTARATELRTRPFLWTQDFERAGPSAIFKWWAGGEHTVNFNGLTEERAFSGRKSFKLDVTIREGHHFYWSLAIPGAPAEGRLKFSGRIFLGEETTGERANLGIGVSFPPIRHSGHGGFPAAGKKGEWILVEDDLVERGKRIAAWGVSGYLWGAKAEEVGVYVNAIGLFLYGTRAQRIVVYLDDIKIEGEVPAERDYLRAAERRWPPAKKRIEEKFSSWEKTLAENRREIASIPASSKTARKLKREARDRISSIKERIDSIKGRGFILKREQEEIDAFLAQHENIIRDLKKR